MKNKVKPLNSQTTEEKNKVKRTKTVSSEKVTKKQRLQQLYKRPKEKFLSKNQELYWDMMDKNQITICFGPSGVGKTYVAVKKALDLLWDENNKYEKIMIIRPAVEAEEHLGSLPGDKDEKLDPYIKPIYYIITKIVGNETKVIMKEEGFIENEALAFLRGWSIDNTILLFEEAQNATPKQMKLLLTRIGYNSKFFISGDLEQSDRFKDKSLSGLYDAKKRLQHTDGIGIFTFNNDDIVRNPLVSKILEKYD